MTCENCEYYRARIKQEQSDRAELRRLYLRAEQNYLDQVDKNVQLSGEVHSQRLANEQLTKELESLKESMRKAKKYGRPF